MAKNTQSNIVSAAKLATVIDPEGMYSRQEVAAMVGCIWANVLDASRGDNPKLQGTLVTKGKQTQWLFKGSEILRWRNAVEGRKGGSSGLRVSASLSDQDELTRLRAALAGTEFEGKF